MSETHIEDIYPLTPTQRAILVQSLREQYGVYCQQLSCRLYGDLDLQSFEATWQLLAARHTVLRTSIKWEGQADPQQVVHRRAFLPTSFIDLSDSPDSYQRFRQLSEEDYRRGFALHKSPLLRVTLFKIAERVYGLSLTFHHIILDGWSLSLLLREFVEVYTALRRSLTPRLQAVTAFKEYVIWTLERDTAEAEEFWRRELKNIPPSQLAKLQGASEGEVTRHAVERLHLPSSLNNSLREFCRNTRLTINSVLQGAWALLLSHYNSETDVVWGTTLAGRDPQFDGFESVVGLCINTIPCRISVSPSASVRAWLKDFQVWLAHAGEFSHVSLSQIREWAELESGSPPFETLFVLENYPLAAIDDTPGVDLYFDDIQWVEQTEFPLTIGVLPTSKALAEFIYDQRYFTKDAVQRMAKLWLNLLHGFTRWHESRLRDIPLLDPEERRQLILATNSPHGIPLITRCVQEMFEAQTERTPDAVAVVSERETVSYAELNRRANRLARRLCALGVKADDPIGVCCQRSVEMVVCLLAVLKAGGAFVPLDPSYPRERLNFMVNDAGVRVILSPWEWAEGVGDLGRPVLAVDRDEQASEGDENLEAVSGLEHLAYVIYTSGSTGQPKGVMVSHRALANHCIYIIQALGISPADRILQFAVPTFDAAFEEIFPTLATGATLVIRESGALDDWDNWIADKNISVLDLPTSFWHEWVRRWRNSKHEKPPCLRLVVVGGERALSNSLKDWLELTQGGISWINTYGPTEATITATSWNYENSSPSISSREDIPIGRAIAGMRAYVLDGELEPVPVDVVGELYLAGVGLARGYIDRPDLTAERFIPDPFSSAPGQRMYRTGDLANFRRDGNIEFRGRTDDQVKVRGFRVELGEVESVLRNHPDVRDCAVVAGAEDGSGLSYLVAGVMAAGQAEISLSGLQEYLSQHMPEFMIPSRFVQLSELPLTSSGKVDRRAILSRAQLEEAASSGGGLLTPTEEVLAGIWGELLGVKHVGRNDHFFRLGGHSLSGMQLVSRILDVFKIKLPLSVVFDSPMLSALASRVDQEIRDSPIENGHLLRRIPEPRRLQMSVPQQGLWFEVQLQPDSPAYNIGGAFLLDGHLDVEALDKAIQEIVQRHEILRATFPLAGNRPEAALLTANKYSIKRISSCNEPETALDDWVSQELRRPFDLSGKPLFRTVLIQLSSLKHVCVFSAHHIIADGWSVDILLHELSSLYSATVSGKQPSLPELSVQYFDYAQWTHDRLALGSLQTHIEYWKSNLGGSDHLALPTDRASKPQRSGKGDFRAISVSPALCEGLRLLAREHNVTLPMLLLAAFNVLLYRYSGQDDITVGVPSSGRDRTETESMIGFFVNLLPIRTRLTANLAFSDLLGTIREKYLEAWAHQDVSFDKLVQALRPPRTLSSTPLFQVAFSFEKSNPVALDLPGIAVTPLAAHTGTSKYDCSLFIKESSSGFLTGMEYDTDLFNASTIDQMLRHWQKLLESIHSKPEEKVVRLALLSQEEREKIVTVFGRGAEHTIAGCVQGMFEAQAERTPEAVAVTSDRETVSYAELNRRANLLARRLSALGVGVEARVGVCCERSVEMVVCLLAVLKAGGAFVPLDPSYPRERLNFMVNDAGVGVILSQPEFVGALGDVSHRALVVDGNEHIAEDVDNPAPLSGLDHLAYVIYTSGSTGQPKGVMISHRALTNRITWMQDEYFLQSSDRVLQKTPFTFDVSIWEFFWPLSIGAAIVMCRPGGHREPDYLAELIEQKQITVTHFVPSMLSCFLNVADSLAINSLRQVFCSGEILPVSLHDKFTSANENIELHNLYGPTEAAIDATYWRCRAEKGMQTVPIGRPIAGMRAYVLDRELEPVPKGVVGELYLTGVGLARGYINRPDLTAKSFLPDPFSTRPGERMYRTGDLASFREDGNLEFHGRTDDQVKVRGFRIELGEVESALRSHPDVQDCIVVAGTEDEHELSYLVAGIIPAGQVVLSPTNLRDYLSMHIPEFMIPSRFVQLSELPLTSSGKVDRRLILSRAQLEEALSSDDGFLTPTEEVLAGIWGELLGVKHVGRNDHFFRLGGHSLIAIELVLRVNELFQVKLSIRDVFRQPLLADLARIIDSSPRAQIKSITVSQSTAPLTVAQEHIFALEQHIGPTPAFNVPMIIRIRGQLIPESLERALREILRRHHALQAVYQIRNGEVTQCVLPDVRVSLDLLPLRVESRAAASALSKAVSREIFTAIDLLSGPPVRLKLIELDKDDYLFLSVMHHAFCDEWSLRLYAREVMEAYAAISVGKQKPSKKLQPQYSDFAKWQRTWLKSEEAKQELGYWRNHLSREVTHLWPSHTKDPSYITLSEVDEIDPATSEVVRDFSKQNGTTPFVTLLSVFWLLLYHYTGKTNFRIGTLAANRVRPGTREIFGLLANTLILQFSPPINPSFHDVLHHVGSVAEDALVHQEVPFEAVVQELEHNGVMDRTSLFQAMFLIHDGRLDTVETVDLTLRSMDRELGLNLVNLAPTTVDLLLDITDEQNGTLSITAVYRPHVFDQHTVTELLARYKTLVTAVISSPLTRAADFADF